MPRRRRFRQDDVIDLDLVTPRLGVVFDVLGDARTLMKVSANSYRIPPASRSAQMPIPTRPRRFGAHFV